MLGVQVEEMRESGRGLPEGLDGRCGACLAKLATLEDSLGYSEGVFRRLWRHTEEKTFPDLE